MVSTLNFEEICSVNAHNGMINSIQVQDDIVISGGKIRVHCCAIFCYPFFLIVGIMMYCDRH